MTVDPRTTPFGQLVSIITPSYNQGRFIERTIRSVKNQDYPNIEHIIVDGGSTDGTVAVLREYEASYPMRWKSEPDRGQSDAVNKGLALATGQVIGWLNSDDLYVAPDAVSTVVRAFAAQPAANVVYGNVLEIDEDDQVQRLRRNIPKAYRRLLIAFNFISQPAVFWRRALLAGTALDADLEYVMDYDLWLRLREAGDFHHVDRFLAGVRYHGEAKNLRCAAQLRREAAEVRCRYSQGTLRQLFYSTVAKTMQRAYRVSAIASIGELRVKRWAVDLKFAGMPAMILHQLPPFGWLRKRLRG